MYEQHFGFQGMPFSANPADWKFFDSESSSQIIPRILHSLQSASGIAVVTGPEGVGKTVLLNHLQAALSRQGQAMIMPGTSLRTADDLYVCIRRSLKTLEGQPVTGGAGRWEVVERLQSSSEFWGPIGLLVDDAHLLSSELFAELQFLLEQRSSSQTLCRLLLAGTHALEETLAKPALSGFSQRIRTFAFLEPLRPAESVEYLKTRLEHVGGSLTECFETAAVETMVQAADGNPRCLDLLADEALVLAFHGEQQQVTQDTVETALTGLQHLPHAWNVSVSHHGAAELDDTAAPSASWSSSSDGVIEIGAPPSGDAGNIAEAAVEEEDDLPALDELKDAIHEDDFSETEPLAEFDEAESDEPEFVEPDEIAATDIPAERTFEAGYLLAEMESVGEPSVEIDEDLDQRLLLAAETLDESPVSDDVESPAFDELLNGLPTWCPAGDWPSRWDDGTDIIRSWMPLPESSPQDAAAATEEHSETVTEGRYTVSIPAAQEPEPLWPPDVSQLGPAHPVAVTDMAPTTDAEQILEEPAFEEPTVAAQSVSAPAAPDDSAGEEWSDGQLLHEMADSGSDETQDAPSISDHEDTPEESGAVRLRIAELAERGPQADDEESSGDDTPDCMFTLPVTLDEVTGDCAPLARSVSELKTEVERFRDRTSDGSHPTGQSAPSEGSPAGTDMTASLQSDLTVEQAAADGLELQPPRIIRETRQVLSTAAPVRQLRPAAGAENTVISEDVRPRLSVTAWSDESDAAEAAVDESAGSDHTQTADPVAGAGGFHNLFTRLRGRL